MDAAQKVVAYFFAVVFATAGFIMLGYAFSHRSLESHLASQGLHANGHVISEHADWMGQGDSSTNGQNKYSYSVTVQYPTKQGSQWGDFGVTETAYRKLEVGSPVEVLYDPADPESALLAGGLNSNPSWMYLLGGTVFALIGVSLFFLIPLYLRSLKQDATPTLDEALRSAEERSGPH